MLSLMVVSGCRNINSPKAAPEAIKGKLDLTHWDFQKDGSIKLKGEWEFYWQQHLAIETFSKPAVVQKLGYIQVPDYWNGHVISGVKLPGEGYATYRLTVLLGRQKNMLALRLMEISTAYTLYINGKKMISAGLANASRDKTVPKWCRRLSILNLMPMTWISFYMFPIFTTKMAACGRALNSAKQQASVSRKK